MSETMEPAASDAAVSDERDPLDAILDRALNDTPDNDGGSETAARARDDQGRFARQAEAEEAAPTEDQAGSPQPPVASPDPIPAAPSGWPADAQTRWDALPRQAQAALAADLAAGRISLGGSASGAADPIREAIRPYAADAAAIGATEDQYVRQTLELRRMIARDPEAGLRKLAADFGVPWQGAQPALPANVPPELAPVFDRVSALEGMLQRQQQETERRLVSTTQAEIDAWVAEKDASGNLARPHYAAIPEDVFLQSLAAIRAANPDMPAREVLQRAYDREIWANESTRSRVLEDQRKAEAARVAEEQRKVAAAARARAVSPRDNPTAAGPARRAGGDNLDDIVTRALGGDA